MSRQDQRFYSRKELAQMYKVSEDTMRAWIKRLMPEARRRRMLTPGQAKHLMEKLDSPEGGEDA